LDIYIKIKNNSDKEDEMPPQHPPHHHLHDDDKHPAPTAYRMGADRNNDRAREEGNGDDDNEQYFTLPHLSYWTLIGL